MAKHKYGAQKIIQNDLQQCINSFERMKRGGVGIADECVEDTCKRALKYIDELEAKLAESEPVRHGHIIWKRRRRGGFRHAKCLHRFCNFVIEDNAPCKHIAKIDERYATDEPYCSECGKLLGDFLNYCGNCGVRMDGDKNDP